MKTIESREDVSKLVVSFYQNIRKDEMLGPIFNAQIPDDHWPAHLEKLTDFWETNLFGIPSFKGNPTQAHINTDKKMNHSITQNHFGHWLQIWFSTIDSLFTGSLAEKAKNSARNMATAQFLRIFESRK